MIETIQSFNSNYTIKQIFKDNWDWFYAKHKDNPNTGIRDVVIENVNKIIDCGDKDKMGFNLFK